MQGNETWLVTGASGLLGHALCRHLAERGQRVVGLYHRHSVDVPGVQAIAADLTATENLDDRLSALRPDIVVHAAGLTNVDECERNAELAQAIHVSATRAVATAAQRAGARFVYISTDHLWDGSAAYVSETVAPNPLNVYARTKLDGERAAIAVHGSPLIVRTNFFGEGRPWRQSFSDWILSGIHSGRPLNMFHDVFFTPLSLDHLCLIITQLIERRITGVVNAAGSQRLSKAEFATRLVDVFGLSRSLICPISLDAIELSARRPKDMSLATDKISALLGRAMPDADAGIRTLLPTAVV